MYTNTYIYTYKQVATQLQDQVAHMKTALQNFKTHAKSRARVQPPNRIV